MDFADDMPSIDTPKAIPDGYKQVPMPPPEISPPLDPILVAGRLQLGENAPMGALGVNLEEYFDQDADANTRIKRVERAVDAIQKDLKTLAPPIKRLITVERDIQALVAQLAEFVETPPATNAVTPKTGQSMSSKSAPTPGTIYAGGAPMSVTNALPSNSIFSGGNTGYSGGMVSIKRLRTGEHKDKTRIVLDASGPTNYRYELDNDEKLLIIDLPSSSWSGNNHSSIKKSPLIASYSAHSSPEGGSRVVIQLKKKTSIKYEGVIKANGNKDYRIVIDLKK